MTFDWQTITVLAIVAVAAVYLARAAWQTVARRKAAACGSCSSCPTGDEEQQVVAIGNPTAQANGAPHATASKPDSARD